MKAPQAALKKKTNGDATIKIARYPSYFLLGSASFLASSVVDVALTEPLDEATPTAVPVVTILVLEVEPDVWVVPEDTTEVIFWVFSLWHLGQFRFMISTFFSTSAG